LPECQIIMFSLLSIQIVCNFFAKIVLILFHAFLYVAISYALYINSSEIYTLYTMNDTFEHATLAHFNAVCKF